MAIIRESQFAIPIEKFHQRLIKQVVTVPVKNYVPVLLVVLIIVGIYLLFTIIVQYVNMDEPKSLHHEIFSPLESLYNESQSRELASSKAIHKIFCLVNLFK